MRTLAEIKANILEKVNKSPNYQGYFTDAKIKAMVNEALDYVAVDMFEAGEGWLREIRYLDWQANTRVLEIPSDVAIINNIRWKVGDTYYPLKFDIAETSVQAVKGTGNTVPTAYRIVQNKIYLNPEPSDSGTAQIEIEFSRYPDRLLSLQQKVMADFDNAMLHWISYYCVNTLISGAGGQPPYRQNEAQWYSQMTKVINLRNRVKKTVQDFGEG
jgi:hypothetical protein